MANLNIQFDQQEIVEAQKNEFEPIPAGTYVAEIARSEVKENNSGSGNRLSLGFKVLEGEYAERLIFQDITLRNTNQIAQQIGRKQMAQLFHACGKLSVQDSQELHGIPMEIKVAIRVDKTGQYDPSNEVKKFAPLGNKPSFNVPAGSAPRPATPQAPVQNAQQPMPPQHAAPQSNAQQPPPWQRG